MEDLRGKENVRIMVEGGNEGSRERGKRKKRKKGERKRGE